VVFLALGLGGDVSWEVGERWGYFPDNVIWEGKPWALITSVFVHLEIWHIAFNVYWLWLLGTCFEETVGSLRWLLFFLGAAWVSASAELLFGGGAGIGMSGVGYALFGFGWVARQKMPRVAEIINDQTAQIFLVWLLLCVALTQFGVMQIANWAHAFGLAFGAAVAALFVLRWRPWLPAAALAAWLPCRLFHCGGARFHRHGLVCKRHKRKSAMTTRRRSGGISAASRLGKTRRGCGLTLPRSMAIRKTKPSMARR
jgi:GlpG protein